MRWLERHRNVTQRATFLPVLSLRSFGG